MKKILSCLILIVGFLLASLYGFSQIVKPAKAVKNLTNLERALARATQAGRPAIDAVGRLGFAQVLSAERGNPVGQSYARYFRRHFPTSNLSVVPSRVFDNWLNQPGERAFYTNPTQLAKDLDAFYEGDTNILISPDGREVKLYMLPVDGILYQPESYEEPISLHSRDYFVAYDITNQTGQLFENKSTVFGLFKPRMYDEIWKAMGVSKEFDDLGNLCDAILMAHLHKLHLDRLHENGITADIQETVKAGKNEVLQQLNNQTELLKYLKGLPRVSPAYYQFVAYVVELPVDNLTLVEHDGTVRTYNQHDHVMLFFEMGGVGIFPRADLQDPAQFSVVN